MAEIPTQALDPDVIIGYDISNFDFPYLLDRAKHLKISGFGYWSRSLRARSSQSYHQFPKRGYYISEVKTVNIHGRLQLSLLQLIQRDHSLPTYSLNSACAHFLDEQKEDIHQTQVTELFRGTAESRRRLAAYCLRGASLPHRLIEKLSYLDNYTEKARVTGVPFNFLVWPDQEVQFVNHLYRKAIGLGLVIPDHMETEIDGNYEYNEADIEPVRGYYDVPITTVKFASLHASIVQAHNLCWSTRITESEVKRLDLILDEDYIQTPSDDMFVTVKQKRGLMGQVLEELLLELEQAKREWEAEADPVKKAFFHRRQLALKSSVDGVYRLTNPVCSYLPSPAITNSTISISHETVNETKDRIEARYTMSNGFNHDAQVIFGADDFLVVKFGTRNLAAAMELAEEATRFVSTKFARPIKLELGNVYFPYLLSGKNDYAGLRWLDSRVYDKVDVESVEDTHQENCGLVKTAVEMVLRMLFVEQDVSGAQEYVKTVVADLLQNKTDISRLIVTKPLTEDDSDDVPQPHVRLAALMKYRDPGLVLGPGDRISCIMIKYTPSPQATESYEVEDPLFVLENNIPIDTKYYLETQLAKPLLRIFEPLLGKTKAKSLFAGAHTRKISLTGTTGGLARFFAKLQTCMACKRPLPEGSQGAVCVDCEPRTEEIYRKTVDHMADVEGRFGRLSTRCQRCQESMHGEVICSSKDCPVLYRRVKAKKELKGAERELTRFDANQAIPW